MLFIRISLIVAILAALGAGIVGYLEVSKQVPALIQQRDSENTAKHAALTELASTKSTLKKTQSDLAQTQQDLADTHQQLTRANAEVAKITKHANELSDKLTEATQQRDDAQNQLAAYTTTGLTPLQVTKLNKDYKDSLAAIDAMNAEKTVMLHTIDRLNNELAQLISPSTDIQLRADLRGKIEAVDPKWDFVVLNVGEDQGIIKNGELLVSREGKLVAKVIVRSVQKDHCIANIVPGWQFGTMVEGDEITPAHPKPASAS